MKNAKKQEKSVKELRREKQAQLEREQQKLVKTESAPAKTLPFPPRVMIIIAASLVVIITLLVLGTVFLIRAQNPYSDTDSPIAVIKMSDGRELVFELMYDEAPIAVTMFHYYAYHGYYNDTIIDAIKPGNIHDSLKMGGYTVSRAINATSVRPKMFDSVTYNNGNYTNYFKEDSSASKSCNDAGALSTIKLSGGVSAEFQIGASTSATGTGADEGKVFGRAFNQKTFDNLRYYAANLQTVATEYIYVSPNTLVKINSIKFYNNKELLKNVNFTSDFKSSFIASSRYS